MENIIYIKFDYIFHAGENMDFYLDKLAKKFAGYPWGGGFSVKNFRHDDTYFYADIHSSIFDIDSPTFKETQFYIQGVFSGWLMADGLQII